ncbi:MULTISPECIES: hypothetical protein [unclassified Paenibacillus]|uniref:hypothetical protein n=1 Tax=unclassified Paenibacillus TaxID=185978 RepID=UPI0024064401|nr:MULTISPECIES: hypothetical protein [unclassified Paenibacillus]MDF9841629.1 hypothetical protein [Paenibacillus sp. PastF-2]MDF9848259.1 hypothetical protein [Paenibacillus sp. PastM-2]MDF9854788.1 hypothetical protein [Paenibacillus sp. PastF-1]MDH6480058.1 hypothetical protein [Paenibacillus sp. PastH-2]MDH6507491.1 hypothetical protein [Paenibacillus sp. PastM-3]
MQEYFHDFFNYAGLHRPITIVQWLLPDKCKVSPKAAAHMLRGRWSEMGEYPVKMNGKQEEG